MPIQRYVFCPQLLAGLIAAAAAAAAAVNDGALSRAQKRA
jgi:hypothetical protein